MSVIKFTEEEVTAGLMAMIAWAGNASAAARALKAEGKVSVTSGTLTVWAKERYADRYNNLRAKYAEQLEAQLAHEYRDVARHAVEVERLALDKALEKLKKGEDADPARTASHAARVAQAMTDKLLSITGRPTSIREDRNLQEIMRSLVAKGVLTLPDGSVEEEPDGTA